MGDEAGRAEITNGPVSIPAFEHPKKLFEATTIPDVLARAARTDRGITLVDRELRERRLAYEELYDSARDAAAALHDLGARAGDRIGLLSGTTDDLLRTLFGTWCAGCVPVVLPLPRRSKEVDLYLSDLSGRMGFVDARMLAIASDFASFVEPHAVGETRICLIPDTLHGRGPGTTHRARPDEVALLQFTSGTTTAPRVVTLTHEQVLCNISSLVLVLDPRSEEDVMVSWLPLFHDMGLIGLLLGALATTTNLILLPTEEFLARPAAWLETMSRFGGTITISPNFGYGLAARYLESAPEGLDLSRVRLAGNGAEPIDHETLARFTRAAEPYGFDARAMRPMYGLAEASLGVTVTSPDQPVQLKWVSRDLLETTGTIAPAPPHGDGARAMVCCGRPLPGVEVQIGAPDGELLGKDMVGEILVASPGLMSGYWNDPAATAEVLSDGWLHTGDLGFMSDDGLYVCGRLKDVIIIGGRNLYPEEYEFWAEHTEGVRRGNVIAFALPEQERMIVVAETPLDGAGAVEAGKRVFRSLTDHLGRNPEEVVMVPPGVLPKTSSGKRRRAACRIIYLEDRLPVLARVDLASALEESAHAGS